MEKYVKSFVKRLYELYGYRIYELKGNYGVNPWCCVKIIDSHAKVLAFSKPDYNRVDDYSIAERIKADTGCSQAEVTVIYIVEKNQRDEFQSFSCQGANCIVVDKAAGSIVYYSGVDETILNEVYQCLMKLDSTKQGEKVNSPVTYTLIGINIAVYMLTAYLSGDIVNSNINVLVFLGAKVNSLISAGQYYRLVTCMFLHGGIIHIGFNMYALYSIGPLIENVFGRKKFTVIYFVSGILSSLMSYAFSSSISIGASGAIFGLLGACLVFGYKMKRRIGRDFMMNIVFVIVVNLIMGFSIPNIDNFGHLGGLIGGTLCSMLLTLKK